MNPFQRGMLKAHVQKAVDVAVELANFVHAKRCPPDIGALAAILYGAQSARLLGRDEAEFLDVCKAAFHASDYPKPIVDRGTPS